MAAALLAGPGSACVPSADTEDQSKWYVQKVCFMFVMQFDSKQLAYFSLWSLGVKSMTLALQTSMLYKLNHRDSVAAKKCKKFFFL